MPWLRVELSEKLLNELKRKKGKMTWESFFQTCLELLEGECDPMSIAIRIIADAVKGDKDFALVLLLGLMSALDEMHPEYSPEISRLRVVLKTLIVRPEDFRRVYDKVIHSQ